MAKIQTFHVVKGRAQFKCFFCQNKTNVAIPPSVWERSIRCHQCGETTRCNFNRREVLREQQCGKVLLTTCEGHQMVADLFDISTRGIGLGVAFKDIKKIAVGRELKFYCWWSARLCNRGSYVVRAIIDQRIGAQNTK